MSDITVRERLANPFPPDVRVNREAGYIDNVLICGTTSRNGRDYPAEVLKRDHAKYEGAPVNCDHKDSPGVADRVGWFSNVRPGSDGRPRGRLNVLKSHPMAERVFEAAERNPSLFGMSHVAVCSTSRRNGRETVESINKVASIDLVADPATTGGLYESVGGGPVISIPTDGKAFAEYLQGITAPSADSKRFAEWLKSPGDRTFAEFLAGPTPGAVPTDGKAFAESLTGGPRMTDAEYQKFLRSIKGY